MKSIIVGTAGHIDHGKSTLIKALTGIDPDRLKEEKERGITIDIGFANLELEAGVQIGFVDVPGHERFIKNMLAGIGGIDAVLLVVAADESIMPQTREHFDICSLLEIHTGAVVITKSDLVDQDILDLVRLELQEYLQNSFLRNAPMIPVSAVSGLGLKELKVALLQMAQTVPTKNVNAIFRLPIDRCFTLHGFGTVVTGTLVSGRIDKEAEVEIYPTGKKSRIRSIQVHGQTVDHASAGQRTALNLQGVEVAEIQRGMELSVPGRFRPAPTVDTLVHLLESSPTSLRNRVRVRFHHGTSEIMATLSPIDAREILPGQTGYARIFLERPILAVVGDKFILRRSSPVVTIGGGTILDTRPPARVRKNLEGTVEFLKAMQSKDLKESVLQLAKRNGISGLDEDQILSQTLVQPFTLRQIIDELASASRLNLLSKAPFQVMDTEAFEQPSERTLEVIGQFHRDEPLSLGMSKEQLYSAIFRSSPHSTFKTVMDQLSVQGRIVIEQDRVRLPGRAVTLNQEEFSAKQHIEEAFLKAGWKVPDLEEVLSGLPVPRDQAKRLVLLLTKEKKLIKLSETLFFHADTIAQLKKLVTDYKKKSDRIDVGAFKNLTDISRKFAIPLLEYLDRERITRRVGESRLIL